MEKEVDIYVSGMVQARIYMDICFQIVYHVTDHELLDRKPFLCPTKSQCWR